MRELVFIVLLIQYKFENIRGLFYLWLIVQMLDTIYTFFDVFIVHNSSRRRLPIHTLVCKSSFIACFQEYNHDNRY